MLFLEVISVFISNFNRETVVNIEEPRRPVWAADRYTCTEPLRYFLRYFLRSTFLKFNTLMYHELRIDNC